MSLPAQARQQAAEMRRMARILREHKLVLRKQRASVQRSLSTSRSELARIKRAMVACRVRLEEIDAGLEVLEEELRDRDRRYRCSTMSLGWVQEYTQDEGDDLLLDREEELRLLIDLQRAYDLEQRAEQLLVRWQRHLQEETNRLQRIERALAARALRLGIVRLPPEAETDPSPTAKPPISKTT